MMTYPIDRKKVNIGGGKGHLHSAAEQAEEGAEVEVESEEAAAESAGASAESEDD